MQVLPELTAVMSYRGTYLQERHLRGVLTLQCAAKPDRWSVGVVAQAPPKGLTCASRGEDTTQGVNVRIVECVYARSEPSIARCEPAVVRGVRCLSVPATISQCAGAAS